MHLSLTFNAHVLISKRAIRKKESPTNGLLDQLCFEYAPILRGMTISRSKNASNSSLHVVFAAERVMTIRPFYDATTQCVGEK